MSDREPRRASATRERLLDAAEELFAEHGVDGVTLRQIGRRAGQHNTSAIQYHFGDRAALLQAMFDRHLAIIDPRHHAVLDRDAGRPLDLHRLVEALVRPLAEHLATVSGRRFVAIQAQLFQRLTPDQIGMIDPTERSGFDRWRLAVEAVVEPALLAAHIRFTVVQFAYVELANWSRRSGDALDIERIANHVMRLVAALLQPPVWPVLPPQGDGQERALASARNLSTR